MTIEELQQQVAALSAQVAAITAPPTDYYTSQYSGEEIDQGVARALPGGGIDAFLSNNAADHPHRNLLDNWDFRNPVNQRGASGTISAAGYFIDRWKLVSGTVTITANGLTLNGTIRQIRENAVGVATTHSVDMYSGTATATYDDTTKYCDIVSSGGTIARCKLEIGSASTLANDPPADYGEQLRKCQRYSVAYGQYAQWGAVNFETNYIDLTIPTPCNMRATPTIINSENIALISNKAVQPGFTFSVAAMKGNNIRLRATKTSHGLTGALVELFRLVLFSADL